MRPWVIVALSLTIVGIVVFLVGIVAADFDFSRLGTGTAVTNTYSITEDFQNIVVDTDVSNISFALSNDGSCEVFCQETEKAPHSVKVENGTLTIRQQDGRKWYDYIGFNYIEAKVVVMLPEAEYQQLRITSHTGKADVGQAFTFNSVDIETDTGFVSIGCSVRDSLRIQTSTGSIAVTDTAVRTLDVCCSTGKVVLSNVTASGNIEAQTSTGNVQLSGCNAASLKLECSTGKITATNTVCTGSLQAQTSTGNIELNRCDAEDLVLESGTGSINASFLTDKIVYAQSDTGKISVPKCSSGGRCEVNTDTGNIHIQISK